MRPVKKKPMREDVQLCKTVTQLLYRMTSREPTIVNFIRTQGWMQHVTYAPALTMASLSRVSFKKRRWLVRRIISIRRAVQFQCGF